MVLIYMTCLSVLVYSQPFFLGHKMNYSEGVMRPLEWSGGGPEMLIRCLSWWATSWGWTRASHRPLRATHPNGCMWHVAQCCTKTISLKDPGLFRRLSVWCGPGLFHPPSGWDIEQSELAPIHSSIRLSCRWLGLLAECCVGGACGHPEAAFLKRLEANRSSSTASAFHLTTPRVTKVPFVNTADKWDIQ